MLAAKVNGDPATNPALRTLVEKGRKANMPKDNIENAIKKGTGELAGAAAFEEITYEGYAAGGVGIIVNVGPFRCQQPHIKVIIERDKPLFTVSTEQRAKSQEELASAFVGGSHSLAQCFEAILHKSLILSLCLYTVVYFHQPVV